MKMLLLLALIGLAAAQPCKLACTKILRPVCGTDHVTYPNKCELEAKACVANSGVTVAHNGKCSTPACRKACPAIYAPVCGSDGLDYPSPCVLEARSCASNSGVTIAHQGKCSTPACRKACPAIYAPVCGSDGLNYPSPCVLEARACASNSGVTVAHNGKCSKRCVFPCTRIYAPVCGHDGKTYASECVMRNEACKNKEAVTIVHSGACKGTDDSCLIPCNRMLAPVCGSDGKKYSNECVLRVAACKQQKAISIVKNNLRRGDDCSSCPICTREFSPVCGSDGRTHSTECMMRFNACSQSKAITKIYSGPCKK